MSNNWDSMNNVTEPEPETFFEIYDIKKAVKITAIISSVLAIVIMLIVICMNIASTPSPVNLQIHRAKIYTRPEDKCLLPPVPMATLSPEMETENSNDQHEKWSVDESSGDIS